jgi:hypothetical protein
MSQIDYKQIKNFPDLAPANQVKILYDLVLRLIAYQVRAGLPITDPILLSLIPQALQVGLAPQTTSNVPSLTP